MSRARNRRDVARVHEPRAELHGPGNRSEVVAARERHRVRPHHRVRHAAQRGHQGEVTRPVGAAIEHDLIVVETARGCEARVIAGGVGHEQHAVAHGNGIEIVGRGRRADAHQRGAGVERVTCLFEVVGLHGNGQGVLGPQHGDVVSGRAVGEGEHVGAAGHVLLGDREECPGRRTGAVEHPDHERSAW